MIQNNEDIFIRRKYEVGRTNVIQHIIETGNENQLNRKLGDYQQKKRK